MRLCELTLRSAPGLPPDLAIRDLSQGLVVLLGSNASGKSTIGRTLGALLWADHPAPGIDATTAWSCDEVPMRGLLVFGTRHWDPPEAWRPPPAELAGFWTLTLRDLLQAGDRSDAGIAREIARQLCGGFDLPAVRKAFEGRCQPQRTIRKEADEARIALRRLLDDQEALDAEGRELDALRKERAQAAEAPAERQRVARAQQALARRQTLAAARATADAFPEDVRALPPQALDTARRLARDLGEAAEDLRKAEEACVRAREEAEALAFPGEPPAPAWLRDREARAEMLAAREDAQRAATRDLTLARSQLASAAAEVWADGRKDPPGRREIEALWAGLETADGARRARESWTAHLERLPAPPPGPDPAPLRAARDLLARWQAAPRPALAAARVFPPRAAIGLALALGIALLILGVVLLVVGYALPAALLCTFGAGLTGAAAGRWGPPSPAPAPSEADALRAAYEREGHPAPGAWTPEAVAAHLARLDADLVHAQDVARARQVRAEAETTARRLLAADQEQQEKLRRLAGSHGFNPVLPSLAIGSQAERLRALAEARAAVAQAEAAAAEADRGLAELRAELAASLSPFAALGLPPLTDGRGLQRAARALSERCDRLESALGALRTQTGHRASAASRLSAVRTRLDTHFASCGAEDGDLARLARREEQHLAWAAADRHRADLERQLQADLEALGEGRALLEEGPEALTVRAQHLDERAAALESLSARIAAIERALGEAGAGRAVLEQGAEVARAEAALAADRDHQLGLAVGEALVDWLQARREQDATPALLERARAWFLAFTRNRHELRVGADGFFEAEDLRTGRVQRLSQLSDATRVQLGLAVRLAFIEQVEAGSGPVPLFLDEVLSTSDPERFRATAGALLTLAARGRQVFYATAVPDEVAALCAVAAEDGWEAPQVVPLGAAPTAWEALPPAPKRSEPPAPVGTDAAAYAEALGLGRPTLTTPAQAWPLALLLHDDLAAVHAAARQGVLTLGQLEALARAAVPLPLPDPAARRAAARGEALILTLEALRVGRGQPVDWPLIEASGAVSGTWTSRVQPLVRACGGDPAALVQAIGGLPRFRATALEDLRAHLERSGHLDDRPRLASEAVVARVQAGLRERIGPDLSLGEIAAFVGWIEEIVVGA